MNHEERVEHWLGVGFATLPADLQLKALERGFTALWMRARGTLGDVTLGAIGERVLVHAQVRFPFLAEVTLDREGLHCAHVKASSSDVVDEAARYLLVELLMILGRLTAEILTPALHDELENTLRPTSAHVRPRAAAAEAERASKVSKLPKERKLAKEPKVAKAPKPATETKPTRSQTKRGKPSKNKKRSSPRGESS